MTLQMSSIRKDQLGFDLVSHQALQERKQWWPLTDLPCSRHHLHGVPAVNENPDNLKLAQTCMLNDTAGMHGKTAVYDLKVATEIPHLGNKIATHSIAPSGGGPPHPREYIFDTIAEVLQN